MKVCSKCKIEKPADSFNKLSSAKDGLQYVCKACNVDYRAKHSDEGPETRAARRLAITARLASSAKTCSMCKVERPKSEFYKAARKKGGLQSNCKSCDSARNYKYRTDSPERRAATCAAWVAANPKKNAAKSAKWAAANPRYVAEWAAKNPEMVAARNRNRKARKRKAEGSHTAADIQAIFEKQQGICANCQKKLFKSGKQKFHVDHIMPLALGGSNWPSNLQCLCPPCNLSKGAKHPDDWAKQQGRLL